MRRIPLLLAALALAGCGGSGAHDTSYAAGLMHALSGVQQPSSLDAASLSTLSQQYGRAADSLGGLTPPAAVASSHTQLVTSLHAYASDLAQASTQTGDRNAFAQTMARAQVDANTWTQAFNAIQAAGYATVPAS